MMGVISYIRNADESLALRVHADESSARAALKQEGTFNVSQLNSSLTCDVTLNLAVLYKENAFVRLLQYRTEAF